MIKNFFKFLKFAVVASAMMLQAGVVRQSFHYDDAGRLIEVRSGGGRNCPKPIVMMPRVTLSKNDRAARSSICLMTRQTN